MTMKSRIILAIVIEIIYLNCHWYVTSHYDAWSELSEIYQGILRALSVAAYLLIFKDYIFSFKTSITTVISPYIIFALLLFFSTPLLIGNATYMDANTKIIYALTSIFVGLKEEIMFRALLQNWLEKKFNPIQAILLTTVIFTIWHVGAIYPTVFSYGQVFFASIILGSLYYLTKSIILVSLMHAIYDALYAITPIYSNVLNHYWGFVTLIAAMTITLRHLYNTKKC